MGLSEFSVLAEARGQQHVCETKNDTTNYHLSKKNFITNLFFDTKNFYI